MFKIGEFSRIARVSMRLLRYYEELGLLRPSHTDHKNGYRYYSAAQLAELNRILVLRDLGLPLEQIGRVVSEGVSTQELRGMLLMRRAELAQRQAEQALQLRLLESRITALETDAEALDDVVIRDEPERRYLSLRARHPSFASAMALVLELQRELPRQLGRDILGRMVGISHSAEFEPDDLDVELGYELQGEPARLPVLRGRASLELRTLPGHPRVASCIRLGSPAQAHLTTARIARYLEASGYRMAGPNREIFLQAPRDESFEDAVIEMAFPIEANAAVLSR